MSKTLNRLTHAAKMKVAVWMAANKEKVDRKPINKIIEIVKAELGVELARSCVPETCEAAGITIETRENHEGPPKSMNRTDMRLRFLARIVKKFFTDLGYPVPSNLDHIATGKAISDEVLNKDPSE